MPMLLAISLVCAQGGASPSYLMRTVNLLQACRADLPAMRPIAEQAAERLAKGGELWACGSQELVSEVCGRAGGLMMIRPLRDDVPDAGDVVLHFPGEGKAVPSGTSSMVITFGNGGIQTHAQSAAVSPGVATAASAWVFTGELIAALTRIGRMPVIYESIGAYGGYARIGEFKNGEVAWHEGPRVKPVAAGVLGGRFIDTVCGMLRRAEKEQRANLDRVGAWARDARGHRKALCMYSMGHIFPGEIERTEIGKLFRSAVWNAGFRGARPDSKLTEGDVVVHIGYQHPPDDLLRLARSAGARAAYVSVRSDRDFVRDDSVVWIDPMWDWPDACVPLDGYDIPILPASGLVNSAIAWEIYRLADAGDGAK